MPCFLICALLSLIWSGHCRQCLVYLRNFSVWGLYCRVLLGSGTCSGILSDTLDVTVYKDCILVHIVELCITCLWFAFVLRFFFVSVSYSIVLSLRKFTLYCSVKADRANSQLVSVPVLFLPLEFTFSFP